MRFTNTFFEVSNQHQFMVREGYSPTFNVLVKETNTVAADWFMIKDSHQISTFDAGKSGCLFFVTKFYDFDKFLIFLKQFQSKFPKVNCEIQICPDGLYDRGDGPGSYERNPFNEPDYVPQKGNVILLFVDAQNLKRDYRYGCQTDHSR